MDKKVQIRPANIEDKLFLKQIEKECFSGAFNENFDITLSNDSYIYLCAIADNQIVGYAGASIIYEQSDLLYVCVLPKFRRQNIAFELLQKLFEELKNRGAQENFLEVEEDNIPAINLYKKIGYIEISQRKNYYGNKTAIVMRKTL